MSRDRSVQGRVLRVIALSVLIVAIIASVFLPVIQTKSSLGQLSWQNDLTKGDVTGKPSASRTPVITAPSEEGPSLPEVIGRTNDGLFRVKFPALKQIVEINPHANVLNRPHLIVPKDDYLGPRPHVDTEVHLNQIMDVCTGSYEKLEYMKNTSRCMDYLAQQQASYTFLPELDKRASQQDPRRAEYLNADGLGKTTSKYVSIDDAEAATETLRGTCPGPIIPYHVYWRGPASWRVEMFIKAYLYTQNLPCSQLNLWLDSDPFPNAVHDMLNNDPLFARFRPFVERGDIVLQPWFFPRRIPIPYLDDDRPSEKVMQKLVANEATGKETTIQPNIVQDAGGQRWITFSDKQLNISPVATSDAVRFVALHLHGGIYFDMDVIMLRDMRPLVLPKNHSFAERWALNVNGAYNTAILSMTANSSLSTYFLRGAVRIGVNFHPLVLGIMAKKDGRNIELAMMEHGLFDALWTNFEANYDGRPITPDHCGDYSRAFDGKAGSNKEEWYGYQGPQLPLAEMNATTTMDEDVMPVTNLAHRYEDDVYHSLNKRTIFQATGVAMTSTNRRDTHLTHSDPTNQPIGYKDSFVLSATEIRHLLNLSIISNYNITHDPYPPNNRTLENFYQGSYTYHIHNQWSSHPEPNSWLSVIQEAHNGFFMGGRTNAYGEMWKGPKIVRYNLWPEFF